MQDNLDGIYVVSASVTAKVVIDNVAAFGTGASGGGISILADGAAVTVVVTNSTIANNSTGLTALSGAKLRETIPECACLRCLVMAGSGFFWFVGAHMLRKKDTFKVEKHHGVDVVEVMRNPQMRNDFISRACRPMRRSTSARMFIG